MGYETICYRWLLDVVMSLSVSHEYVYINVGLPSIIDTRGHEYVAMNITNTTPSPYLFGVRPTRARTGDTVTAITTGTGATQGTYSGYIQAQSDDGIWNTLTPQRWQQTAAAGDAYSSTRLVTDDMVTVDVEHVQIDIVIPPWADPPHMPIRVVTDGP